MMSLGPTTNGLTANEVEAEVFDSTPSAFRPISGDPSMMFGNVDALRRGEIWRLQSTTPSKDLQKTGLK